MDLACSFSPFAPLSVALYSSPETVTCLAPAHTQGLVGLSLSVNGVTVSVGNDGSNSASGSASGVNASGVIGSDSNATDILPPQAAPTTSTLPFTYLDSPIVRGMYPQMGVVEGGATVTIYGQGWLSLTHSAQTVPTLTLFNSNQCSSSTYLFIYTPSPSYTRPHTPILYLSPPLLISFSLP